MMEEWIDIWRERLRRRCLLNDGGSVASSRNLCMNPMKLLTLFYFKSFLALMEKKNFLLTNDDANEAVSLKNRFFAKKTFLVQPIFKLKVL